jgi:tetratricopeptide (TPR) repeat protein
MKQITDFLVGLRSLLASIVVITVSIALITILYRQLSSSAIIVEPIRVPDALAKTGYTSEILAQRLMDNMFEKQQQATTKKEGASVTPEWQRFDMEVPGSGITIGTIGNVLRESIGIQEKKITGEVISSNSSLQLRLRLLGTRQFSDSVRQETEGVEALLKASAEQAVKLIEPFMYASYLYANGQTDEVNKALDYCQAHCSDEDKKWALNLRGVLQADKKNWDRAIEGYQSALEVDPRFAIAYHNWAMALIKKNQPTMAYEKLLKAERLDPDITSKNEKALLSIAIGQQMHKESKPVEDEIEQYRLALKLNPNESKAYMHWGKALSGGSEPDYESAIEKIEMALDKAKTQYPDDGAVVAANYALWGQVLEKMEDYEGAISKNQLALKADPQGYEYLSKINEALEKKLP